MHKDGFQASHWLTSLNYERKPHSMPAIPSEKNDSEILTDPPYGFSPSDYFISGWKGESLLSKDSLALRPTLNLIFEDVKQNLMGTDCFNPKLKSAIHQEFVKLAQLDGHDALQTFSCEEFWGHLQSSHSVYQKDLEHFSTAYALRVVVIYLFKIRFLTTYCNHAKIKFTSRDLLNPSFFLSKIFIKGSSQELNCESLQSNRYTWYRPHHSLEKKLVKLVTALTGTNLQQLFRIVDEFFSEKGHRGQDISPSVGHSAFGKIINQILLFLPKWFESQNTLWHQSLGSLYPHMPQQNAYPEVLTSFFQGDYLNSMALSHWLAQSESSNAKWDQIICPEFFDENFSGGLFLKLFGQLQFLTSLVVIAEKQNHQVATFICHIISEKNRNLVNVDQGQMTLFQNEDLSAEKTYDRIVINISEFPKKNPNHFLIQKIHRMVPHLKKDGFLVVSSHKNLFIPSQKEKIDILLKELDLVVNFNLENLYGRGDIPAYLYVFKSKHETKNKLDSFQNSSSDKKQCLTFRLSGELKTLEQLQQVEQTFAKLFKKNQSETPSLYSKDLGNNIHLQIFQDAIADGILINSSSKDQSNITHPQFFNKMMASCERLENFFQMDVIQKSYLEKSKTSETRNLLGLKLDLESKFQYFLLVDFRDSNNIKIELNPIKAVRGKFEDYGFALCCYFGLVPKRKGINLNLFREYFSSDLGKQILKQTLVDLPTKAKSKLENTLVPKFFGENLSLPTFEAEKMSFMLMNKDALKETDLFDLQVQFNESALYFDKLKNTHPWALMGHLCHFKNLIHTGWSEFDSISKVNYANPHFITPLMEAECSPLFPANSDIHVEFKSSSPQELQSPLQEIKYGTTFTNGEEYDFLEIWANDQHIVSLYTEKCFLEFLKFLLEQAVSTPILPLLRGLHTPTLAAYKRVLSDFFSLKTTLQLLKEDLDKEIKKLIKSQVILKS